ncbi:hypothetical protein COLO4_20078 [Corchorus olitorius]|uniref:Uncharacterized protein n=1 Tax=Corchorus olitorius TaxID=93759 RepID=A0A1R3J1R4_9ROSI|nr:hypothetical protein COLO4_20078 [Corchorus olitorius]
MECKNVREFVEISNSNQPVSDDVEKKEEFPKDSIDGFLYYLVYLDKEDKQIVVGKCLCCDNYYDVTKDHLQSVARHKRFCPEPWVSALSKEFLLYYGVIDPPTSTPTPEFDKNLRLPDGTLAYPFPYPKEPFNPVEYGM